MARVYEAAFVQKSFGPRAAIGRGMTKTAKIRVERFKCNHCGTEGWYNPRATHVLDPRVDHDRSDGRKCRKSEGV